MFATRQLLRAAGQVAKQSSEAIPAPTYFRPASEAPSPNTHIVIAIGVGTVFAMTYKMYYWNWKKELNQFYYDYNKTMAELADAAARSGGDAE